MEKEYDVSKGLQHGGEESEDIAATTASIVNQYSCFQPFYQNNNLKFQ